MIKANGDAFGLIFVCASFLMIGPALILLNQYILKTLNFPYPMFLSGLGVVASGLFSWVTVKLGFVKLEKEDEVAGILWYKRVLPVGIAHASTLAFGNIVYLYLNVGFIQMLKSFTPATIILISYLAKIDVPSQPVVISVLVITIGTITTCSYSPEINVVGLIVMLFSQCGEGVRLILTQYFLQQLKFGVVEGKSK